MADTDLIKFLGPNFHFCPPTDVRFWFKTQDGSIKEVKAHKVILASNSDVFNREFYGSLQEDDIEIKDASQEVFLAFVEFMYKKKPNYIDADIKFLASLYYLGDKYNTKSLRDDIIASISEYEVSEENVVKFAILADQSSLHQPLSDALFKAVTSYVMGVRGYENKFERVMELISGYKNDGNLEQSESLYKVIQMVKKEFEYEVSKENVVKFAILADQSSSLHQPLSNALFEAVTSYVMGVEGLENKLERVMELISDENLEQSGSESVFKVIQLAKKELEYEVGSETIKEIWFSLGGIWHDSNSE